MNVALIGGGKLALGHIMPMIDGDHACVTLVLRSLDENKSNPVKHALHDGRRYLRCFTDSPDEKRVYEFDDVKLYEEIENDYWETVDVIIVSVGTRNYQSTAAHLADALRARNSEDPICLLAFENDIQPAQSLIGKVKQWFKNLNRGKSEVLLPCDVAVDSMCGLAFDDAAFMPIANGQRDSDTVILPKNAHCEKVIRALFLDEAPIRVLSANNKASETIMRLLEKKKAWFVNAIDYIVASSSLANNSVVMDPDDSDVLEDVNRFCAVASKVLECECDELGLSSVDRELVMGPSSFLGECLARKEATLENIRVENDKERDKGGRGCYKVLSDLGTHKGIYEYFDSVSGGFSDGSREGPLSEEAEASALGKAMSDFGKSLSDDSRNDGSDIVFRAAQVCMASLYAKANIAPYLAKVQQRLVIVPSQSACSALGRSSRLGDVSAEDLALVNRILDGQISVANRQLFDTLDSAERVLEMSNRSLRSNHER